MLRRRIAALALTAALAATLGTSPVVVAQQPRDMENPVAGQPDAIAKGESRFSERCTFCHGTRGKGAKGPCLTCGHFKWGGRNADLYQTIAAGRPGTQMGSFASSLTGEEIWQIIAFLRDQEQKRRQAQSDESGARTQ
jgi:mono/diheme cytochrome c family protein